MHRPRKIPEGLVTRLIASHARQGSTSWKNAGLPYPTDFALMRRHPSRDWSAESRFATRMQMLPESTSKGWIGRMARVDM